MSTDFSNAPIARERSGDQVDEHPGERQEPQIASTKRADRHRHIVVSIDDTIASRSVAPFFKTFKPFNRCAPFKSFAGEPRACDHTIFLGVFGDTLKPPPFHIDSSVDSLIMKAALRSCSMHFEAAAERRRFGCRDRAGPCRRRFKFPTRLGHKSVGVSVPGRLNARDETEHDSDC